MGVCNTTPERVKVQLLTNWDDPPSISPPFHPWGRASFPTHCARHCQLDFSADISERPEKRVVPELSRYEAFRHSRDGRKVGDLMWGDRVPIVESKWRWSCFVFFYFYFLGGGGRVMFFFVIFPAIMVKQWRHVAIKTMKAWRFLVYERNGSRIALSLKCWKLH